MHQFRHNNQDLFGLEPGPYQGFNVAAAAQFGSMNATAHASPFNPGPMDFEYQQFDASGDDFAVGAASSSPDPRVFLFSPEQLTRHVSCSDDSSFTSSTPASPLMGNNFAGFYSLQGSAPGSPVFSSQFQDMSGGGGVGSPYSTSIDANSPRTVSEEFQSESPKASRDYPVVCLHPGCEAKPFKRRADLDRHYKHKHAPASQKDAYYCDYPKCARRRDPFHRRDHFRDHLREFHKEDIEKRGGGSVVKDEDSVINDRNTPSSWWRCAKCLVRNYVEESGYDCPLCKTSCQAKRKEIRMRD
ncbi:hypothetical protein K4F52_008854 [Lecanicillium sp. MT-2017a]|nr:hypothetical protein K4F52_008854 [Lecanicillium sp. MT-2017a]